MRNATQCLVVAIPSDVASGLSAFEEEIRQKSQSPPNGFALFEAVHVHEVTQLVDSDDEGLGDCFVVSLSYNLVERDDEVGIGDDETLDASGTEMIIEKLFGDKRAEIWVTSTEPIPLAPPYGWRREEFIWDSTSTSPDSICHCLRKFGLAIVCQTTSNMDYFNNQQHGGSLYSRAMAKLREHVGLLENTVRDHHPHIQLGESAFGFQEYTHRGPGRFEVLFDPDGTTTKELYELLRDGLEYQWIESVCQYLQSDRSRLRLNISCVYSRPGAMDQEWHTDGDHYSLTPTIGDYRTHQPYAICIFVPLISLTQETGFTRFWPRSHLYPNLLGLARAAETLQATLDGVNLQPGDYVMYDYTTWHKGIGNSSSVERPIIQFLYSCDWYKERKNYGTKSVFDIH